MNAPYRVDEGEQAWYRIVSDEGKEICRTVVRRQAFRIAAVLNFCDGWSTETLVEQYNARTGG